MQGEYVFSFCSVQKGVYVSQYSPLFCEYKCQHYVVSFGNWRYIKYLPQLNVIIF